MTTPDLPPMADAPDDEIVSAYLDGEATPAEVARVESDPALQARLAEMRAVVEAVARPVPSAPAAVREAAIARVLAAADPPAPASTPTPAPTRVVDLAAARARRERFRRGIKIASIAAAVAAAIALPALAGLGEREDSEGDSAAPELTESFADENFAEGASESGDAGPDAAAEPTTAAPDAGNLGAFEDERALGSELAARLESGMIPEDLAGAGLRVLDESTGAGSAEPSAFDGSAADAIDRCAPSDRVPVATGRAILNGDPVSVALYAADAGIYDLVVVQYVNDTCRVDVLHSVSAPGD